jgi:hypothetical protein
MREIPRAEGYDGYHIDKQTGAPYRRVRPLRHVFDDLDRWRNIMTEIHFSNVHGDLYGELVSIHDRLHDDLMAAQFSERE